MAFTPAVGSLTYTVTGIDGNGCQNTDAVLVTVNPNPVLTVSPSQTFCLGDQITLSASGADSYDWDSGSGSLATYQVTPTGDVTITVVGTNVTMCSSTETIDLFLDDPNNIDAGC